MSSEKTSNLSLYLQKYQARSTSRERGGVQGQVVGNRLSHSNLNDQRVGDGRLMESNWTKPRDDSKKRKNSPSPSKGREGKATTIKIERGTTIVKPRTITVEHGASQGSDDEQQLMLKCEQVGQRVSSLKLIKYQQAVEQYANEMRKNYAEIIQHQTRKIEQDYYTKRQQVLASQTVDKQKIVKAMQELTKYKSAYQTILQDVTQKKTKLQKEYQDALASIIRCKQELLAQWTIISQRQITRMIRQPQKDDQGRDRKYIKKQCIVDDNMFI